MRDLLVALLVRGLERLAAQRLRRLVPVARVRRAPRVPVPRVLVPRVLVPRVEHHLRVLELLELGRLVLGLLGLGQGHRHHRPHHRQQVQRGQQLGVARGRLVVARGPPRVVVARRVVALQVVVGRVRALVEAQEDPIHTAMAIRVGSGMAVVRDLRLPSSRYLRLGKLPWHQRIR